MANLTIPNKVTGDPLSAQEVNQIVTAINTLLTSLNLSPGSFVPATAPGGTLPGAGQVSTGKAMMIGTGTYTQPTGGTITVPANTVLIITFNGTNWVQSGSLQLNADLTDYTKVADFNPVKDEVAKISGVVDTTDLFTNVLSFLDGNDKFLAGFDENGHFYASKYRNQSIPQSALITEEQDIKQWPLNAIEALAQAYTRRVDIVEMGDSNMLHHGYGFNHGIDYALSRIFAQYASPAYYFGGLGNQGAATAGQGGLGSTTPPPGFEQWDVGGAQSGTYLETGSIGSTNGLVIDIEIKDTEGAGSVIVPAPTMNVNSNLRYWVKHAIFAGGTGSFRPGIRRESSPYGVIAQAPEPISTGGPANDVVFSYVDMPAANRNYMLGGKIRIPNTGATVDVGPNYFLLNRMEDLNATAGFSSHVLYAQGGQSLYDMANSIYNKSLRALGLFFEETRRLQIAAGQKPIVVYYFNSGLNDLNETSTPSFGWRAGTVGNSVTNYIDNCEAIMKRIEDVWQYRGWDLNELFFLIIPSHPLPDDTILNQYRKAAATLGARTRCSFVDFNNLTSWQEMFDLQYFQSANTDYNHLVTAGYNDLSTRFINLVKAYEPPPEV